MNQRTSIMALAALLCAGVTQAQVASPNQNIPLPKGPLQPQLVDPLRSLKAEDLLVTPCRDEAAFAEHFDSAEQAIAEARSSRDTLTRARLLQEARAHLRAIEVASNCRKGMSSSIQKKIDDTRNAVINKI